MKPKLADALPKKKFFQEMFTRDISLEDCILDLIDNSIDSLIRTKNINISEILLQPATSQNGDQSNGLPTIDISYSDRQFKIVDKCGGITRHAALTEVFNFGHTTDDLGGQQLGAYGIGLKRALFKIGNEFDMESKTQQEGFSVSIPVPEWAAKDEDLNDWKVPLVFTEGAGSLKQAGTSITIRKLRPEVRMRINDGSFESLLVHNIAQTYSLFLNRHVKVTLNSSTVVPDRIPLSESDEIQSGRSEFEETFEEGKVKVIIIAGLAERVGPKHEWNYERAGWYVLCNGRVVVAADKTDLTGWNTGLLPSFHHGKYRGFVGLAFFMSTNPLLLPWTTTKRGLNRESLIYQKARNQMGLIARPVISFLNDMYKNEPPEERFEREAVEATRPVDIRAIASRQTTSSFKAPPKKRASKSNIRRIQFDAKISDIERVKRCIRSPDLSASKVGEYTFEHFLKKECPE
jgi:hypothetical protein